MYELRLFIVGGSMPKVTETVAHSADVLTKIPLMLEANPGCERIDVHFGGARLFSVGCDGNTIG